MKPKAIERARKKVERARLEWKKSVEYYSSRDHKNIVDFNKAGRMEARRYNKYQEAIEELRELEIKELCSLTEKPRTHAKPIPKET